MVRPASQLVSVAGSGEAGQRVPARLRFQVCDSLRAKSDMVCVCLLLVRLCVRWDAYGADERSESREAGEVNTPEGILHVIAYLGCPYSTPGRHRHVASSKCNRIDVVAFSQHRGSARAAAQTRGRAPSIRLGSDPKGKGVADQIGAGILE